jgi:DNA recombination-dependent growth factor C
VGFLSGSTTVVRFVAAPPPHLDRDAVARAVTRRVFRDLEPDGGDRSEAAGWVGVHDPLATTFTPADLFFQRHLAVGFRYDRRAVPAKLLSLERRRAEEALKAERGLERLGATARKQVKTDVEARLLLRALPTPRLFDCVWNLDTGRLYFSGRARRPVDAFVELFRQTFGVGPVPLIPYLAAEHVGLPPGAIEGVRSVAPCRLTGTEDAPARDDEVPRLPLTAHAAEVTG